MATNEILPDKKFTRYQVLVIILLSLTQFTVVLDFMVMSPLGDMLMKSMSLTTSQFGFAVSGYALSAGASGLLTAGFADKFDRKKLLLFFYIGFTAGTLLCGFASSYIMLLAARIITGIFGGVIGSISMAILADLFPLHQRGRAMGFMQMGFGASQVLGIPVSLYIANIWGWQSPFIMIVGLAAIIWLVTMLKMHPVTKHLHLKTEKTAITHFWHTLIRRDYRTGFLLTALLSLGGFMMMPWGSAFAVNNLHVSYSQLPSLFMASGIAALIIMPMIGKLSDKIDKVKIFTVAAISMMVIIVIYTNLTPIPFAYIVLLNVLMMTAIMSRIVPAMALVSALPKMQDRGAFMSINSSLQQIAGGIAAGIGGMIVVQQTKTSPLQHYNTLGYLIVVIIIANIFQMFRVSNLLKRRKDAEQL
ncbi:MAG TPA: MFS transporter [Chitinophagaceae bacterium]|nr:MFS transporter [Chitinophagaceae bacterium]